MQSDGKGEVILHGWTKVGERMRAIDFAVEAVGV